MLFVLEIAQTRTLCVPSKILRASIRYSVPLAVVSKGSPGAVMLGCTTKSPGNVSRK